ncbi:MAG: oxidoreductase [Rhodospirillaceae bacterium]|nr:oxidoreductase [Rhodospirillaceae bacterium]
MALIKNGQSAVDLWCTIADRETIPADGPVIISLKRWTEEKPWLKGRRAPLGIFLQADQPPAIIEDDLDRFEVVSLEFPTFRDGRAYSYARLLRERYCYTGEIRAVGDVLRDQLAFMQRCGINSFEIADNVPIDKWIKAIGEISVFYQTATDARQTALDKRRNA